MSVLVLSPLVILLAACGTFQVGVETAPAGTGDAARIATLEADNARLATRVAVLSAATPAGAPASPAPAAAPGATPGPALTATLAALQAENARLATQVAAQAAATPARRGALPLPATRARIYFPRGSTTYTFTTNLARGVSQGYVLQILGRQRLVVTADVPVGVEVLDPTDHPLVPGSVQAGRWEFEMPQTDDYTLVLLGEGQAKVTLVIPPL